jgi:hypothetical protein
MRLLAISLFSVLLPLQAVARSEGWPFVESVGGIAIDSPKKELAGWVLPVRADVSGLSTITVRPTLLNSALACLRTNAAVEDQVIYIAIVTGLVRSGLSPLCPPARLGAVPPGKYRVFYRGPSEKAIELSEVEIAP